MGGVGSREDPLRSFMLAQFRRGRGGLAHGQEQRHAEMRAPPSLTWVDDDHFEIIYMSNKNK